MESQNLKCPISYVPCPRSIVHSPWSIVFSNFLLWLCLLSFTLVGTLAYAMSQAAEANPGIRQVFIGVFRQGAPDNMNYITKYEEQVGAKPATIMWYQDWACPFPSADAKKVTDYGAVPHIVWEAMYWTYPGKITIDDIIAGKWDGYIRQWAKGAKEFGQPLFLRIGHEFNVDIYSWSVGRNGKDPEKFIKFYRHVVDIFKQEKASNVKWVWSFNNYSNPDEPWNNWVDTYPGDAYVDWIGIDGYNWGKTQSWSGWETFLGLFRNQMRVAHKLWLGKPIMIAEFSCAEKGGEKAAWLKDLPGSLKSSMRDIDLLIWFDVDKEVDWRIKSSKESLAAYQEMLKDQIFSGSGEALASYQPKVVKLEQRRKTIIADQAKQAIKIDGNLSDWPKKNALVMKDKAFFKEGLGWGGLADLSGTVYLMWDETNLYLAAEITDNYPLSNKQQNQNVWNGDALEMVLGLDPAADPTRTSFGRKDYQIGFSTGDGKDNLPIIWNWQRRRIPEGGEIVAKKKSQPFGYVLEAKVPWSFFKAKVVPASGLKLGFDIAFDDADKAGVRERQFIWNGDYYFYKDPSVWDILELE